MSQFSHKFEFSHDETEGISIPKTLAPNFPTHFPIIPIAIIYPTSHWGWFLHTGKR